MWTGLDTLGVLAIVLLLGAIWLIELNRAFTAMINRFRDNLCDDRLIHGR